jgi:hypothetical protein
MPRFLLELRPIGRVRRADAVQLAALRYPEVAIEQTLATSHGDGDRELWVCRAPSETHLRRWAEAAELDAVAARLIDHGDAPGDGPLTAADGG